MSAKSNGKSWWNIEPDEDPKTADKADEALKVKADKVAEKTLEQLQGLVKILVQLEDSDRLLNLLACNREIFRQADQAMSQGKKIDIIRS